MKQCESCAQPATHTIEMVIEGHQRAKYYSKPRWFTRDTTKKLNAKLVPRWCKWHATVEARLASKELEKQYA
jgi:hypothetical protein